MSRIFNFLGNLATIHKEPAETNGAFSLVEMIAPVGDQPPLHVHRDEDEGFHVLEGELTLWLEGYDPMVLGPGRSVVAPHGLAHTYKVTSDTEARWFVTSTPGLFGQFVVDFGEPTMATRLADLVAGPPDMDRLNAAARVNGIDLLGPPGTLPTTQTGLIAA